MLEDKRKVEDFSEEFKLALIGSDPLFWLSKLYPEVFGDKVDDDEDYLEGKDIEWVMPEMTEEDREVLLKDLLDRHPDAMSLGEYEDELQTDWQ